MNGLNAREIAEHFSSGKFTVVEKYLSDDIVWNIYEEKKVVTGKESVIQFMKKTEEYFKSVIS